MNKKKAFTLAEVLITLGIIGIVAAMTLPMLVAKHRKKVIETKLYTTYNILQNMVRMSVADNGDPYNWDLGNNDAEIFEKYFAPYLKIIQKCKKSDDDPSCDTTFKNINGTYTRKYSYKYILNNGVGILFYPGATSVTTRRKGTFLIDILSGSKGRIVGQNVFPFNFIVDGDRYYITASQDYPTNNNDLFCRLIKQNKASVIDSCKSGSVEPGYAFGIHCTALIECNGWKIPDDYPVRF